MPDAPPPAFAIGQPVRVILNQRNHTPHLGAIRKVIWHHKDQRYHYYIRENGKNVSKRYFDDDLEPVADFEADIEVLPPTQSVRRTPAVNGIRWDFQYAAPPGTYHVIHPDFIDAAGHPLPPNLPLQGHLKARMRIVFDDMRPYHRPLIHSGVRFTCMEGPHVVARGVVTRVTGLSFDDTPPNPS
jgi:hypothetical protein